MDSEIGENELPEFPKKRLVGENRIAGVEIKSCPERCADFAGIEGLFQLSNRALPSPVLMDIEGDLSFLAKTNHGLGLSEVIGHRLLTDDRGFGRGCQLDHLDDESPG